MVFNLVEFNKQFRYFWWLLPDGWEIWRRRKEDRWPHSTPNNGVELLDP
jgi:hypothetical protein